MSDVRGVIVPVHPPLIIARDEVGLTIRREDGVPMEKWFADAVCQKLAANIKKNSVA